MSSQVLSIAARDHDASPHVPPRRALVVEDDDSIRGLVTRLLRLDGFHVEAATNGPAGLQLICEREYEVILLDLALPGINGVELLEHLRDRRPPTLRRVVIMTASHHLLRQVAPDEVCRVITKPFNIDQLRAAVGDCSSVPH